MGVGNSLLASYALAGPIPAGTWSIIGDGLLAGDTASSIDIRFEVVLRPLASEGDAGGVGPEQPIVVFQHHFVRDPNNRFGAVAYSDQGQGVAATARAGDLLVWRMVGVRGDPGAIFIPNGDGPNTGGRIPRLDLPH